MNNLRVMGHIADNIVALILTDELLEIESCFGLIPCIRSATNTTCVRRSTKSYPFEINTHMCCLGHPYENMANDWAMLNQSCKLCHWTVSWRVNLLSHKQNRITVPSTSQYIFQIYLINFFNFSAKNHWDKLAKVYINIRPTSN